MIIREFTIYHYQIVLQLKMNFQDNQEPIGLEVNMVHRLLAIVTIYCLVTVIYTSKKKIQILFS